LSESVRTTYVKGFTGRSLAALLFSIAVIEPTIIYFNLISNMILPLQAWITIILWSELSNLLGFRLRKQELFFLLAFQPISTMFALFFLTPIKNMYYSISEPVEILGIDQHMPNWWVPRGEALEVVLRSPLVFLHPAWIPVFTVSLLPIILNTLMDIVLGIITYNLFVVVEKLQFPAALAQVETIVTLSDRVPSKIRILLLSATIGIIFNLVAKFLPYLLGSLFVGGIVAYTPQTLMFDFTYFLDYYLPGGTLTVTVDIVFYAIGMILPVSIALSQFIGAIAFYLIGTYIITLLRLWPPESVWVTGWGFWRLVERADLYFYTSVRIGLSFAALIVPILINPKPFLRAFSILKKVGSAYEDSTFLKPFMLLIIYLLASTGNVLFNWYLTDFKFPIFPLAALGILAPFFITYLMVASMGVTYIGIPTVPYLKELTTFTTGYRDRDIWFTPFNLSVGGSYIAQTLLQADMSEVRHSEYFRSYFILIALGLLSSFIYTMVFWWVSPIPSSAYPATIIAWPVDALTWARTQIWVWTGYLFRPLWIGLGLGLGAIIYLVTHFLHASYVLISFITGGTIGWIAGTSPIAATLAQLIGSITADRFFVKKFGDMWRKNVALIVMGIVLGDGLMEILRGVMILIMRSMWILPY